ncbi:unnamed protein product [Clonostachys rosea f. rosea IK726]|uniref:Uncharacterized protein n=1 Tax=Clonostachys rosea f. rosea IK726 TaxID=1349383 RepID=A0ACA9UCF2_BIOOC|nr:unnamed protein product [Clonostachys rosea f. rosea IK726]
MLYDLNVPWSPSTTDSQLLQTLTLSASLGYGAVALNTTLTQAPSGQQGVPFPKLSPDSSTKLPRILHRATLVLDDPAASNFSLPALVRMYDILAVRPLSDKAFQNACLTFDTPIISMDLTQNLGFYFRPKPCMAAVSRGVRFEICYSQALAADARGRAQFIANATGLIHVVNLLDVWGLGREKGMEGLGSVPRSVVVNEGVKRTGFRGVVDVVQALDAPFTKEKQEGQPGQGGNKKDKKQKRKNGEETQKGDKHQSKKMKLVSRDADTAKK